MFFPGETVSHGFVIPFSSSDIHHVVISYKQHDQIILEKTVSSGFINKGTGKSLFSVKLTQADGLLFFDHEPFTIQCNVFTKGGSRHTSREIKGFTGTQYLREVMKNG